MTGVAAGRERGTLTAAKGVAAALPDLLVEARRIAATILAGWHGRRRAGPGETFWQFRPFVAGEAAAGIDWRRSARDDQHLYVREKEWEAAHTAWLAPDLSASMDFRSRLAPASKRDRAVLLVLAMAEMLARAGERVGVLGHTAPMLSRNAAEKVAVALAGDLAPPPDETRLLRRDADVLVVGDFLDPITAIELRLDAIAARGARAHLVQVLDPVEETFPFAGRTEFRDPETGARQTLGRAEQVQADYAAILAARRDRLAQYCRRREWTFLIHRTDQPATGPLLALHARLGDRGVGRGRAA